MEARAAATAVEPAARAVDPRAMEREVEVVEVAMQKGRVAAAAVTQGVAERTGG